MLLIDRYGSDATHRFERVAVTVSGRWVMGRRKGKGSAGHDAPVAHVRLREKADLRQEFMSWELANAWEGEG